MLPACPKCYSLNAEGTVVCAVCGTAFLPALQAQPTETAALPQETMPATSENTVPAPQPDEFTVNHSEDELTITWGIGALRKASAVGFVVLPLLALLALSKTVYAGDYCAMSPVLLLLLATGYWLTAMFANRTSLRVSDEEWVVGRGPVPVPYPVYYWLSENYYFSKRRMDPQQYEQVIAVKEPPRFGRSWVDILLYTLFEHETYTLYAKTPPGGHTELVTGLKERQARYLARQLQGILDTGMWPAGDGDVAAQDTAAQATSAEPALEWLAEAAQD